tara:strand:- start:91 stop:492 length:402 start_codon:yes stop_codon:yes gene_type:complete
MRNPIKISAVILTIATFSFPPAAEASPQELERPVWTVQDQAGRIFGLGSAWPGSRSVIYMGRWKAIVPLSPPILMAAVGDVILLLLFGLTMHGYRSHRTPRDMQSLNAASQFSETSSVSGASQEPLNWWETLP